MSRGRDSELALVVVYPHLLGGRGDPGNTLSLVARARERGRPVRVVPLPHGAAVPLLGDLYYLGGGEDAGQVEAGRLLARDRGLPRAVGRGATVFGVCGGLQVLARAFRDHAGVVRRGLGLLDVECGWLPVRAAGEAVVQLTGGPGEPVLTGFEDHRGAVVLGAGATALGTVRAGVGNGHARLEGAVTGRVVGTQLRGPVLARNPALADRLLDSAAGEPVTGHSPR